MKFPTQGFRTFWRKIIPRTGRYGKSDLRGLHLIGCGGILVDEGTAHASIITPPIGSVTAQRSVMQRAFSLSLGRVALLCNYSDSLEKDFILHILPHDVV